MATDKSLRQHYAMQGKIKNYLGKQKMVKAPVKWKSGPDHPNTELAYITKAEKDLILKADLHSSLSKGPNRGPSGIISLNSAGSGYGGPGPGRSGNGEGQARELRRQYTPPAPTPSPHRDPTPVAPTAVAPPSILSRPTPTRNIHVDTPEIKEEQRKLDLKQMIKSQQEEKYGVTADPTKFGEIVEGPDKRTQREKDEDVERATDWDKVKDLSKKGYNFKEIQDAMDKGLLTKADPQSMKTGLLDRGIRSIRNIIPKTGLERSLLSNLTKNVFAPTTGGQFDLKKMATGALKSMALKKLGLGALNPLLGLASLFGFDPFKGLMNKFARKPVDMSAFNKLGLYDKGVPTQTTDTRTAKARDAYKQPISTQIAGGKGLESGAELLGLKSDVSPEFQHLVKQAKVMPKQTQQIGHDLPYLESGVYTVEDMWNNAKTWDDTGSKGFWGMGKKEAEPMTKEEFNQELKDQGYTGKGLAVKDGGRIDRPLMGRRRDI